MKKYYVEYLDNGAKYNIQIFTDFMTARKFYNSVCRKEWARMS